MDLKLSEDIGIAKSVLEDNLEQAHAIVSTMSISRTNSNFQEA